MIPSFQTDMPGQTVQTQIRQKAGSESALFALLTEFLSSAIIECVSIFVLFLLHN